MFLKRGSKGEDVRTIQIFLKIFGFKISVIDGDFGPETEKAIKAYQKDRWLVQDGEVGDITLRFLQKDGLVLEQKLIDPLVKKFIDRMHFHASEFVGFTEVKSNASWDDPKVSGWQKETSDKLVKGMLKVDGWELGAPYCAAAVGIVITFSLEDCALSTKKFLDLWTAHVMTNVRFAKSKGFLSAFPSLGAVWLARFGSTDSGHTGIVLDIQGDNIITIEGNTVDSSNKDPAKQRQGDGFFQRKFNKSGRGTLKTQGFISAENIIKNFV